MTSSFSEKLTKVKNALEHVFVKKTDIKNNLTSTDTDKPLSANQGKVLNDGKVDKVSGKGLSKNDFTDTYKGKLDDLDSNLSNKANSTHTHGNLQNDGSVGTSNNVNKNVITDGNGKITTEDKPTIPSDVSQLTDSNNTTFTPKSHTHGDITSDGKIGTNANYFVTTTTGGKLTTQQLLGYIKTNGAIGTTAGSPIITGHDGKLIRGEFGTTTGTFAAGNHSHSYNDLNNKPSIPKVFYGTCNTTAATNPKVITTSSDFVLETGVILMVKFDKTQTYDASSENPLQLVINNLNPVNVALYGTNYNIIYQWVNGEIVHFIYDGQDFRISNRSVASTTYFGVTKLYNGVNSTSTSLSATANAVKQAYDLADAKLDKAHIGQENKNVVVNSNGNIDFENKPTIPSKTSDLTNDSGFLTSHQNLDGKNVTIEKQATAESGYTATYVLKQGGTALSPKINIPKDYLVKSGTLETVGATPTTLESTNNLTTGDKYLKFIVNTQENDDSTTLIIPVTDLIDTYRGDNSTITLNNGVFSVKSNVFANKSHSHGNISNNGAWTDTSVTSNYHTNFPLFADSDDNYKIKRGYISASRIKDGSAYSYIGSAANASQSTINGKINTELGNLNDLIGNAITYINQ